MWVARSETPLTGEPRILARRPRSIDPGLGDPATGGRRLEGVAPFGHLETSGRGAEAEEAARFGLDHGAVGRPGLLAVAVGAPESGAGFGAGGPLQPGRPFVLGRPFAHPGQVGDHGPDAVGRGVDLPGHTDLPGGTDLVSHVRRVVGGTAACPDWTAPRSRNRRSVAERRFRQPRIFRRRPAGRGAGGQPAGDPEEFRSGGPSRG